MRSAPPPITSSKLSFVALGATLVAAAFLFPWFPRPEHAIDFGVFHEAGLRWLQGESVYRDDIHLQFKYGPLAAWIFAQTIAHLAFTTALTLHFYSFRAGWLLWAALISRRILGPGASSLALGLTVFLLFLGSPLAEEVSLGQMNLIPIAALTGVLLSDPEDRRSGRATICGLLLSIALEFKLYAALALPVLVFRRQWRTLGFTALFLALLGVGLPAISSGIGRALSENAIWITNLSRSTDTLLSSRFNSSLLGVVLKAGIPQTLSRLIWIASVTLWIRTIWRRRNQDGMPLLASVLAAIVALNPLAWSYWAVFLFPALLLAIPRVSSEARPRISRPIRISVSVAAALILNAHASRLTRDGGLLLVCLGLLCAAVPKRTSGAATDA